MKGKQKIPFNVGWTVKRFGGLDTGNEEAGRIVCDAAREYSKNQPKKVRKAKKG